MKHIWFALVLCAVTPLAGQARAAAVQDQAIPPIKLPVGSTFSIGLDATGKLDVKGGRAGPLSSFDVESLNDLVENHPDAMGPNGAVVHSDKPPPQIESGHIRFTFASFGKDTVLVIENGFPRSFMYRARIGRGSQSAVTDVCQIMPSKRGYEHWPYPIDWIEITDIRPVEWTGALRCE